MNQTIKTFLLEALGVPEGIIDTSQELYKKILSNILNLSSIDDDFEFTVNMNSVISGLKIKKIEIQINFTETDQVNEVKFYNMSFHHSSKYDNTKKTLINKPFDGELKISINIAYPENTTVDDVKNYFKNNEKSLVPSLAHELKHSFDSFINPKTSLKSITKYVGLQKTNFPFKPISNFLYNLYFIHNIENLVRPTEFASLMSQNNVNKKDFYEFVTSSELYLKLKKIQNFSYVKLRESLKKDIPNIKSFLTSIDVDVPNNNDEIVDELLRLVYVNIVNNTVSSTRDMMANNIFENFLGFSEDKENFFYELAQFAARFSDREPDFFKYEEKKMKYFADKMLRKIYKLYDLADTDKSSIKDWELHQKISGKTNETIDKEYKLR